MSVLDAKKVKLVTLDEPSSIHSEMYRSIKTNLDYSSIDKKIQILNITSSVANEAKTTTACNIAIVTANKAKKVLLVDLDLRNPSVHRAFNIKNHHGITDMLVDFIKNGENINIYQYARLINHPNIHNELYLIPTGTEVSNTSEILGSKKIKELFQYLKRHFDEIILDSSPSGILSDGVITSTLADGTIFVVESGKTKIEIAQKTVEQLNNVGIKILGVVLTKVPYKFKRTGYYNYYGSYYLRKDDTKERFKIHID